MKNKHEHSIHDLDTIYDRSCQVSFTTIISFLHHIKRTIQNTERTNNTKEQQGKFWEKKKLSICASDVICYIKINKMSINDKSTKYQQ